MAHWKLRTTELDFRNFRKEQKIEPYVLIWHESYSAIRKPEIGGEFRVFFLDALVPASSTKLPGCAS